MIEFSILLFFAFLIGFYLNRRFDDNFFRAGSLGLLTTLSSLHCFFLIIAHFMGQPIHLVYLLYFVFLAIYLCFYRKFLNQPQTYLLPFSLSLSLLFILIFLLHSPFFDLGSRSENIDFYSYWGWIVKKVYTEGYAPHAGTTKDYSLYNYPPLGLTLSDAFFRFYQTSFIIRLRGLVLFAVFVLSSLSLYKKKSVGLSVISTISIVSFFFTWDSVASYNYFSAMTDLGLAQAMALSLALYCAYITTHERPLFYYTCIVNFVVFQLRPDGFFFGVPLSLILLWIAPSLRLKIVSLVPGASWVSWMIFQKVALNSPGSFQNFSLPSALEHTPRLFVDSFAITGWLKTLSIISLISWGIVFYKKRNRKTLLMALSLLPILSFWVLLCVLSASAWQNFFDPLRMLGRIYPSFLFFSLLPFSLLPFRELKILKKTNAKRIGTGLCATLACSFFVLYYKKFDNAISMHTVPFSQSECTQSSLMERENLVIVLGDSQSDSISYWTVLWRYVLAPKDQLYIHLQEEDVLTPTQDLLEKVSAALKKNQRKTNGSILVLRPRRRELFRLINNRLEPEVCRVVQR